MQKEEFKKFIEEATEYFVYVSDTETSVTFTLASNVANGISISNVSDKRSFTIMVLDGDNYGPKVFEIGTTLTKFNYSDEGKQFTAVFEL